MSYDGFKRKVKLNQKMQKLSKRSMATSDNFTDLGSHRKIKGEPDAFQCIMLLKLSEILHVGQGFASPGKAPPTLSPVCACLPGKSVGSIESLRHVQTYVLLPT